MKDIKIKSTLEFTDRIRTACNNVLKNNKKASDCYMSILKAYIASKNIEMPTEEELKEFHEKFFGVIFTKLLLDHKDLQEDFMKAMWEDLRA